MSCDLRRRVVGCADGDGEVGVLVATVLGRGAGLLIPTILEEILLRWADAVVLAHAAAAVDVLCAVDAWVSVIELLSDDRSDRIGAIRSLTTPRTALCCAGAHKIEARCSSTPRGGTLAPGGQLALVPRVGLEVARVFSQEYDTLRRLR